MWLTHAHIRTHHPCNAFHPPEAFECLLPVAFTPETDVSLKEKETNVHRSRVWKRNGRISHFKRTEKLPPFANGCWGARVKCRKIHKSKMLSSKSQTSQPFSKGLAKVAREKLYDRVHRWSRCQQLVPVWVFWVQRCVKSSVKDKKMFKTYHTCASLSNTLLFSAAGCEAGKL